jgi:hypothetical protein
MAIDTFVHPGKMPPITLQRPMPKPEMITVDHNVDRDESRFEMRHEIVAMRDGVIFRGAFSIEMDRADGGDLERQLVATTYKWVEQRVVRS